MEPSFAHTEGGALWLPAIGQVRNPCFARAVHRAVERRVRLREHEEVAQFLVSGDQVQGIRTPQGIIEDDRDIVHAGAWMAQLLVQLDRSPAVEKN